VLTIIEKLLGIVTRLFGARDDLAKARDVRRLRIVSFLDQVASCLAKVASELEAGHTPHGACAELATYAGHVRMIVEAEVGSMMAQSLADELQDAHNVEALLVQLKSCPDPKSELRKLWEAVGRLHAIVTILKATP
jgi:hypothetical protein